MDESLHSQRAGNAGSRQCSHSRHRLGAGILKAEVIRDSRGYLGVPVINEQLCSCS